MTLIPTSKMEFLTGCKKIFTRDLDKTKQKNIPLTKTCLQARLLLFYYQPFSLGVNLHYIDNEWKFKHL